MLLNGDDDDDNGRGTLRVIPSARLDTCVCDGGGCADINDFEVKVAAVAAAVADVDAAADVDLPCRASDSVIGTAADAAAAAATPAPFRRTSFTVGGSGVGTGTGCNCCVCGSGPGVVLGRTESDVRTDLGLCTGAGVDVGAGAGTGWSGIGGAAEGRTGVGEGGSIRFWERLVLSVARGGKSCVPFCGRAETGGLIPSLPEAGTATAAVVVLAVLVPLCMCTSFLYSAGAVSLDCDSNIMGRLE